jgi:hypothetical protein
MRFYVDLDTQLITLQPFVASAIDRVSVPRAGAIPLDVYFTRGGEIVDPDAMIADIDSSAVSSSFALTSISNATPAVFTKAGHGLVAGDPFQLTTSGTLPTGLSLATTYYVIATGLTSSAFQASATVGGSAINTSSTGSGTHTLTRVRSVITTDGPHGIETGDSVEIEGHIGVDKTIVSSSVASSTVITTALAHGLSVGDTIVIDGHIGSVPAIGGTYAVVTAPSSTTFTISVNVTTAGSGGTVTRTTSTPDLDGTHTATAIDDYSFSIPVIVTVAGEGGTATKRSGAFALRFTAKEDGKFDGVTAAECTSFQKFGKGDKTVFRGSLNTITTEIDDILNVDVDDTNDVEEAELMAEFSWDGYYPSKTNWVPFFVRNDIYKAGDGTPIAANGVDFSQAISNGADTVTVTLALSSANWHCLGAPLVVNTTDVSPLGIWVVGLTARTSTTATFALSAAVDSANYKLEGSIRT